MIKVGITGGSSKAAAEVVRLLLNHPDVDIKWIHSEHYAGQPVSGHMKGLVGECDLVYASQPRWDEIDVVFNCRHTGDTRTFLELSTPLPEDLKIIDLSGDYRMISEGNEFVYGLPELNRKSMVRGARKVANPGAFATAVELALLPLAKNLLLNGTISVMAVSGDPDLADNIKLYKPFKHSHVAEITQTLGSLQNSFNSEIVMVPMLGSNSRGLVAAVYLDCPLTLESIRELYEKYYDDHNFTFIVDHQPDVKDVVNTNKCVIYLEKHGNKLLITSMIDSLLKGSAGTAVHNMNLLFGLSERTGLALKTSSI